VSNFDSRVEDDIAAYAAWRRDPNRVTADDVATGTKEGRMSEPRTEAGGRLVEDEPRLVTRVLAIEQEAAAIERRAASERVSAVLNRFSYGEGSATRDAILDALSDGLD
jgi:hypothetical protein